MPIEWISIAVALVLFIATLVRSAFGFGEALIAVPLLALMMPVDEAAPLAVLVSITIAALILIQDWRRVHLRSAGWLIFSTLFGIPLGLVLLELAPAPVVKALLAVIIIGFSAYTLASRRKAAWTDDRYAWIFGFHAGVLGGAYGMNGPPLAVYGTLRGWTPEYFRATLQAYFLPASIVGMAGYRAAGLWTPVVNHLYVISLPGVLIAILLGHGINRRLDARRFLTYVHAGLIVIGVVLLTQAAFG
ncbi:MAG: sulfite exporter TauE/SafE family protein [Acidobacteriota bacterium]